MDPGLVRGTLGSVTHRIPARHVVSSADLWTDRTYWNSLHPNCKFEQARRAAGIAAAVAGVGSPEAAAGPDSASAERSADGRQVVPTYTNVGSGLTTADGSADILGFAGIRRNRNGTLHLLTPHSVTLTAPDRITLTFGVSVDGVGYHVLAEEVFGESINRPPRPACPPARTSRLFD